MVENILTAKTRKANVKFCEVLKAQILESLKDGKKEESLFSKNKSSKDGLQIYCKICLKQLVKTKYKISTTRARETYYKDNKDKLISIINNNNKNRDFGLSFIFNSMRRRCKYPSQINYKYYGGKGITVVWKNYKEFKKDMYKSYIEHLEIFGSKETTIDRIDSDGNYCKENCRWATMKEQIHNRKFKKDRLSTV